MDKQKRPGNFPCFLKESKQKQDVMENGILLLPNMSPAAKEPSPAADLETVSQIYTTANIFFLNVNKTSIQ